MKTKPFHIQFSECSNTGFTGKGEILKFKDHPELLPFSPKAAISIKKHLEEAQERKAKVIIFCFIFMPTYKIR